MDCVKEGGMKRHVLCSTSVFSFSVHITKLSKIQTYLKVMVNTKKILKSSLQKIYVQQAFFLSACILQNLVKYKLISKKILKSSLQKKLS